MEALSEKLEKSQSNARYQVKLYLHINYQHANLEILKNKTQTYPRNLGDSAGLV
jgi:hypothetical protein